MNVVNSTAIMKKYSNLFNKICTIENFRKAYKNATKGKKHYTDVKMIERIGREKYLHELLEEVKNKKYKVSQYEVFNLYTGHKWREIYKLPMKDRIVQHAIMIYLEPIFRETFILDTYSSIKTRGIHLGLQRVKKALKKGNYTHYAKLDVHKCYPSLDKNILKEKLSRKFLDKDLLQLLYTIIDSCENGVPIGNYTSQYFENFYFSQLDHWIKEVKQVKGYFRYCDDIIILSDNKKELHQLVHDIIQKMQMLNVVVKSNWQIYSIDKKGIDFLGYIIRKDYIKIRKHTKYNFIEKLSSINFKILSSRDINILGSYWGILSHADCRHLWKIYTGVKKFKDLNIEVCEREFVRNIIGIPLIITDAIIFNKKGQQWLKLKCNYVLNNIEHNNVILSTSGEMLVEAAKQLDASSYPFETIIITNDKGYYKFN